jgi:hypothetical protein
VEAVVSIETIPQCSYCPQKMEDGYMIYECERCGEDVCTACTSQETTPLACNELTARYAKAMSEVYGKVEPCT